jgi:HNH endonuclease
VKEILLRRGFVVLIDDDDYLWASQFKWCVYGRHAYVHRALKRVNGKQMREHLHRAILGLKHGDSKYVDHIDGNGLNNQKSNLRLCTMAENIRNQKLHRNNSTGFKGVSWNKQKKKFKAYIKRNYKNIHLGYYRTASEAGRAYDKASQSLHGDFARPNTCNQV